MNRRQFVPAALLVLSGSIVCLWSPEADASGPGLAAANQVSQTSYQDFMENWLYTHDGDNRGSGPEHDLARDNIETFFTLYGLDVTLEPFQYGGNTYYNVVGTLRGTVHPGQIYIIGAHFDSVDNPGADDNASGTSLVLEAARILSQYESDATIRFIAFDREEQGLIGSDAYVQSHLLDNILGMISADMVAYDSGTNSGQLYGQAASDPLKNAVAAAVLEYGDGLGIAIGGALDASDHAPFEWANYQACVLIEQGWGANPHYHQQSDSVDTPNYIDYGFATRMTRSVVGWLVDTAGVDVPYNAIEITLPDGVPEYVAPDGGTTIRVEVAGAGTEVPAPDSGLLHYNDGGGWLSVPMTVVEPDVYDAAIPASDCPGEMDYYFSVESMSAQTYYDPWNAPDGHYSSLVAYGKIQSLYEDFEDTPDPWVAENLGASTGDWQRGVPVNDPSWDYDPVADSDGSGQCFLTQNQMGNTDVDDGAVRLTSPTFAMAEGDVIAYDYYLYLTNTTGGVDRLLVEVSNDGGLGTWATVATHTTSGGLSWRTHEITTADLVQAGVPPTSAMKIRFTANDADPQSINEAGIDAFRVFTFDCGVPCPGDVDGSGTVDVTDFLQLLADWGSSGGPSDVDGDGTVGVGDFLQLLAEWGPCP
jgi:hypothetical protein